MGIVCVYVVQDFLHPHQESRGVRLHAPKLYVQPKPYLKSLVAQKYGAS